MTYPRTKIEKCNLQSIFAHSTSAVIRSRLSAFQWAKDALSCELDCQSGLMPVLESRWICFPDFEGLESPWKKTWSLKVLESLSESPWKCLNLIFWNSVPEQVIFSVIVLLQFKKFMALRTGIRVPPLLICFRHLWSGDYFWRLQVLLILKLSNVNWTC